MIFKNDNTQTTERRRNLNPTPYSGLGKLPPQACDMEEAVLGALMLQKDAYLSVGEFLKVEMFYRDIHQKIYNAIQGLLRNSSPVDILTVIAQLRTQGELEMVGGAYAITEMTDRVSSTANVEFHARIVYQKYLQREMIRISTDTINSAYEDTTDIFELHNNNQTEIFNLFSFTNGRNINTISALVDDAIIDLSKPAVTGLTGVGSGFIELDTLTNGWQKSDLIIVAARPAMGKTAFVLKCARNAAVDFDKPVLIFSLEMAERQLTYRLIADEAEILYSDILKRRLADYEKLRLSTALAKLKKSHIHIDDTAALSIDLFRTKCIRMKKKHNIQLIVIDYLQLMTVSERKNGNREQEISKICAALKGIAKELDIPVIALSQLSRAVESRAGLGKRPMLSDLRESGSIEQDADQVFFLYRPDYYGITEDENNNSVIGLCELICAKNRHGATDTIKLKFIGKYMRFIDWITDVIDKASNFIIRPSNFYESDNEDKPF